MAGTLRGRLDWSAGRSKEGHREYMIKWLVKMAATNEGPATAFTTPGLPAVGSTWNFGADVDNWAFCQPDWTVRPVLTNEPGLFWTVEQKFSTRPLSRCQDTPIESPLDEPPRISGSFVKFVKERAVDRFGKAIRSSSQELFHGAVVEFDDNRPTVDIEITSLTLPLSTFAPLIDVVNDAPMWGLSERMVKLSNAKWQRHLYGTCTYYFTIAYNFEINYLTFDRRIVDSGTRCLYGWAPGHSDAANKLDPDVIDGVTGKAYYLNPMNYEVYKDINGENSVCLLDGRGRPLDDGESPEEILFEYYPEEDLFALGIPASFT